MFFGQTTVNYYDRMITKFIRDNCTEPDMPSEAPDRCYQGTQRCDEFLLMYAAHNIKMATVSLDTNQLDNLLVFIRNYITQTPEYNLRIFFVKEQTDFIDSWFDGTEGNFETTEAINTIVAKTQQAMCSYERPSAKIRVGKLENNIIVMSNYNIDRSRFSQLFLALGLIPMFYEQIKETLTETELNLCKQMLRYTQLSRKPKQDLLHAVTEVERQTYIQEILFNIEKEQFFTMLKESVTEAPRNRLERAKQNFTNIKEQYVQCLDTLQRAEREYFAATNEDTTETDEGIRAFLKHPNLLKIQRDNGKLYVWMKTPLDIYDPDYADCLLNNMDDNDNFKILWKELYEKEQGFFISSSVYIIPVQANDYGSRIQVCRDRPWDDDRKKYEIGFNPHHFFFNCLGQFEVTINEVLKNNNFAILGDLLATCTRSINLADTAVFNRFKSYLNDYPDRYYVKYKDEVMTVQQAVRKIKEEVHNEENSD